MIKHQSQVAGKNSHQLLPQAKSEAFNENAEKQGSSETFLSLVAGFLGLNVDQQAKGKQDVKLKGTGFNSFDELMAEKPGSEINMDLIRIADGEKKSSSGLKGKLLAKNLPDELLMQVNNLIEMAGGQDRLIPTAKDAHVDPVQLVQLVEGQFKIPAAIEGKLKVLNELLGEFQVNRSGENTVLTIPMSKTELTPEQTKNIQEQLSKIIRQLSDHSDKNNLKQPISGSKAKTDIEVAVTTDSHEVTKSNNKVSRGIQFASKNKAGLIPGDTQHGKVREGASRRNQKADTQQTQKSALKDLVRSLSGEVETKAGKSIQLETALKRLSSESKESGLFSTPKAKSELMTKQQSSQPDQRLQTNMDLSKHIPEEKSKKEGESASHKLNTQNTKKSSPARLMDKSQVNPIQISTITESKKIETDFKPTIKIEVRNGDVNMEFQSQGDNENGDNENGKSPLKFSNTSFNQLTKSSGRREFSSQMIKQLQKQADQSGLGSAKNWSQHRFMLENGEAVNVSVRQSEGVMQLQLGSGNSELNKILLQHINEIREHLQEQMNIDIDLQLQQFGDQQTDLNENGQNSGNGKQEPNNNTGPLRQRAESDVGSPKKRVSFLGFNQNEWTA